MAREYVESPPFGRQNYFFRDIYEASQDLGLQLYCFSPLQVTDGMCQGWTLQDGVWKALTFPVPYLIYERIWPVTDTESKAFYTLRAQLIRAGHCFLNPPPLLDLLKDKTEASGLFEKLNLPHLATWGLGEEPYEFFYETFNILTRAFIKPIKGSHGQKISLVGSDQNGYYHHIDKDFFHFPTFEMLWQSLKKQGNLSDYLIQAEGKIHPYGSRPHDVRVLVQHNGEEFKVSGMCLRVGSSQGIVSNFNAGGTALALEEAEDFFQKYYHCSARKLKDLIAQLCLGATRSIEAAKGRFFELGFDILLTQDQGPVILEANGKPGRWTFQVIADTSSKARIAAQFAKIRQLSCRRVAEYACSLL